MAFCPRVRRVGARRGSARAVGSARMAGMARVAGIGLVVAVALLGVSCAGGGGAGTGGGGGMEQGTGSFGAGYPPGSAAWSAEARTAYRTAFIAGLQDQKEGFRYDDDRGALALDVDARAYFRQGYRRGYYHEATLRRLRRAESGPGGEPSGMNAPHPPAAGQGAQSGTSSGMPAGVRSGGPSGVPAGAAVPGPRGDLIEAPALD